MVSFGYLPKGLVHYFCLQNILLFNNEAVICLFGIYATPNRWQSYNRPVFIGEFVRIRQTKREGEGEGSGSRTSNIERVAQVMRVRDREKTVTGLDTGIAIWERTRERAGGRWKGQNRPELLRLGRSRKNES